MEMVTTASGCVGSSVQVARKCIVIMEGNPRPGTVKGRLSFQNFNPPIDMKQIWEEFVPKINELLELGQTGVVASILASCRRLSTNRLESSQTLSAAISSHSESPHI